MSLGIAINSTAKIDIVSVAITSRATNLSRFATLEVVEYDVIELSNTPKKQQMILKVLLISSINEA